MTRRCKCGGTLRVATDITEAEEEAENRNHDAAILACTSCGFRVVLTFPRRLPPELRARLPQTETDNAGDVFAGPGDQRS